MLTKCKNTSLHENSVFEVFLVRMRENIDQKNSEYRHFYVVFSFKTVRKIEWPFFKKSSKGNHYCGLPSRPAFTSSKSTMEIPKQCINYV